MYIEKLLQNIVCEVFAFVSCDMISRISRYRYLPYHNWQESSNNGPLQETFFQYKKCGIKRCPIFTCLSPRAVLYLRGKCCHKKFTNCLVQTFFNTQFLAKFSIKRFTIMVSYMYKLCPVRLF